MTMNDAEIRLQVKIDDSDGQKSFSKLSKSADNLGSKFVSLGKTLTTSLTLPIIALGTLAVKSASDLGETINKIDVAFGDSSDEVKSWGKTTLKQFGIAEGTALDMAATFGDMATGMGFSQKKASSLSTSMVGLAGDLASFKNISIDVAETALASVFTGETESLKKLGIVMTEANLEQFAMSKGIKKTINKMTQAEKVQLRYDYVMEMSKNSIGDFNRTSDSTANQLRITKEMFKQTAAELGENLLPIVNKILNKVIEFLEWFGDLDEKTQNTILIIAGIVAAIGPLITLIGGLTKGIGLASKAMSLLAANPTILIFAAMAVAIGVIITQVIKLTKALNEAKAAADSLKSVETSVSSKRTETTTMVAKKGTDKQKSAYLEQLQTQLKSAVDELNRVKDEAAAKKKSNPLGYAFAKKTYESIIATNQSNVDNIRKNIRNLGGTPKYEKGTNYVPNDGLAYLHKGEAVVPKKYNYSGGSGLSIMLELPSIELDGNKLTQAQMPYITRTVKVAGGNI